MKCAIILLLLSGCAVQPVTQYDKEVAREVRIVWHKTEQAFSAHAALRGGKIDPATNGFYYLHDGVCHVYAPDPKMETKNGKPAYTAHQWATLGHEIKHCFDGRFHD